MWATYTEWKALGRVVGRGMKSRLEDPSGNKLFHNSQTKPLEKPQVLDDDSYHLPCHYLDLE